MALVAGFSSCEDEQDLMFLNGQADFRILTPDSQASVVLVPELPNNPALSISWEDANYGTPTEVTYTIEADLVGDDFDNPTVLATTNNTFAVISTTDFNSAVVGIGLTPFTEGGIEIRVKSTVGTGGTQPLYSNVITYLVTPYSTDLPKLYVPGSYQSESGYGNDWTPADAPALAASAFGETDYEGYVYIAQDLDPQNSSDGFKFTSAPNWDNTNYGDDGSFSGVLASPGNNVTLNAGYYRMRVNTGTLSYNATPTTWGIIGSCTPGSWDNSTPLTYNPTTKTWEGDVTIGAGKFKFRANNQWDVNLGGGADDFMAYNGSDIDAPTTPGSYHVVLDLSNPRKYTYTLTLNP